MTSVETLRVEGTSPFGGFNEKTSLLSVGDFNASIKDVAADVGTSGKLSGKITLTGYDAVRSDEQTLNLTAKVTYDATKKISLIAALDSSTPWEKPFGLTGTKISVLSLTMDGTYQPFAFKTVDFASTLESVGTKTGLLNFLHIKTVAVEINIDTEAKTTTLNGTLTGNIPLFPTVGEFGIELKEATLKIEKIDKVYSTDVSGKIALKGYDPTRTGETALILNGGVSVKDKTLALNASLDPSTPWLNPFGLTGSKITVLSLSAESSVDPFVFNTLTLKTTLESVDTKTGLLNFLQIKTVAVEINIDTEAKTTTLNGTLTGNIPLFPTVGETVGEFGIDLNEATLKIEKIDKVYSTDVSGKIALKGYDPTRTGETALILNGGVSVKEKTLSLSASLDPSTPWENPFGLTGTKITVLSLSAESSLDPFKFKKFDFDATLAWNEKGKGTTGASEFMYDDLGIRSLVVAIKVDSEAKDSKAADSKTTDSKMVVSNGAAAKVIDSPAADSNSVTMSLSGEATVKKELLSVGAFKITLTQAGLEFAKNDSVYSAVISSQISLAGYDPSQSNEPDLLLNGSLAVSSEKKITLNVALDPTNSWINPFGLSGTKISDLSLDVVGKLSPASLTVDFDATLVWDSSVKPKEKSASEFLHSLGVDSISVHIGLDTENKSMSISGTIDMQIQIIHVEVKPDDYFSLTLTQTTVAMELTFIGTPDLLLTLLGRMELKGYDTSQRYEPTLTVTGAIKLSLTGMEIGVSFTTGATPWENPFGLKGFEITTLAVQIGATYVPPFLDSFGFVADVGFYSNSIIAGFYIKLSDPTVAFYIETKKNQPLNLVKLIDDALSGFKKLDDVRNFVDKLFGKSNITIESVDGDKDGDLDPLILFSPMGEVKVVDQVIPGGMGLNAKLKIGGFSATLILNVSEDFKKIFAKISFSFAGDEYSAELSLNGTKVHLNLDSPWGDFKFDVDLANLH